MAKRAAARGSSKRPAKPGARARKAPATRKKSASARKTSAKRPVKRPKAAARKTAARAAASRSGRRKQTPPKPSPLASAATLVRGAAAGAVAAISQRLPWSANENDPLALLETDHRRFEHLLKQGEETTARAAKGRRQLLDTLTAELNVHELIEERILYPALKEHPQAHDVVLEGYQEHHVADLIVNELHALATDDEKWGAKFKVLKENVEHHIEEEEQVMFRTARAVLSREELDDLGARMKALKAELEAGR